MTASGNEANRISPQLLRVLWAALALYVAGSAVMQVQMLNRIGALEHHIDHLEAGHAHAEDGPEPEIQSGRNSDEA